MSALTRGTAGEVGRVWVGPSLSAHLVSGGTMTYEPGQGPAAPGDLSATLLLSLERSRGCAPLPSDAGYVG